MQQQQKRLGKRKRYSGLSFFVLVVSGSLMVLGIQLLITFSASPYILSSRADLPDATDAVLVLGAKVYSDGRLSPVVQERADAAIALRKAGKAKRILVSGDNRTKYYDEVTTIKNYLVSKQVPLEVIFLDFAGLDTYDSVYRASYIFQVRSLLIPTQSFHVGRAVFLARSRGIDAYGFVPNKNVLYKTTYMYIREFFARVKAGRDVFTHALPHHLGDKIPIDGVSNSQNYSGNGNEKNYQI